MGLKHYPRSRKVQRSPLGLVTKLGKELLDFSLHPPSLEIRKAPSINTQRRSGEVPYNATTSVAANPLPIDVDVDVDVRVSLDIDANVATRNRLTQSRSRRDWS
jgi:hypothetical protein